MKKIEVPMFRKKIAYVIVNFGGPSSLKELRPFLETLFTDPDVVRTKLPLFLQRWYLRKIAKKKAKKIQKDYGKNHEKPPLFFDTESIAFALTQKLDAPVLTFHRYLPDTHLNFLEAIKELDMEEIRIFPMFPQFSYATSGSIARFFAKNFEESTLRKIRWIKSYPGNPFFIQTFKQKIDHILTENQLIAEETILFFSAYGIPENFVETGDIYESECQISFSEIMKCFPYMLGKLGFQVKFGLGQWLKPHTEDLYRQIDEWAEGRKNIVIIPLSFTSDHIETLHEIEHQYIPLLKNKGYRVFRCPAFNQDSIWIDSIVEMLKETNLSTNQMLIRQSV